MSQAALQEHKAQLVGDAVVHTHLAALYDTLLEQNLVRLVEPFSRVEVAHLAELIKLPLQTVLDKLSQVRASALAAPWLVQYWDPGCQNNLGLLSLLCPLSQSLDTYPSPPSSTPVPHLQQWSCTRCWVPVASCGLCGRLDHRFERRGFACMVAGDVGWAAQEQAGGQCGGLLLHAVSVRVSAWLYNNQLASAYRGTHHSQNHNRSRPFICSRCTTWGQACERRGGALPACITGSH